MVKHLRSGEQLSLRLGTMNIYFKDRVSEFSQSNASCGHVLLLFGFYVIFGITLLYLCIMWVHIEKGAPPINGFWLTPFF